MRGLSSCPRRWPSRSNPPACSRPTRPSHARSKKGTPRGSSAAAGAAAPTVAAAVCVPSPSSATSPRRTSTSTGHLPPGPSRPPSRRRCPHRNPRGSPMGRARSPRSSPVRPKAPSNLRWRRRRLHRRLRCPRRPLLLPRCPLFAQGVAPERPARTSRGTLPKPPAPSSPWPCPRPRWQRRRRHPRRNPFRCRRRFPRPPRPRPSAGRVPPQHSPAPPRLRRFCRTRVGRRCRPRRRGAAAPGGRARSGRQARVPRPRHPWRWISR
mmetsp:Transcript_2659/g.7562  ORF Transcript_2659/g.7562 Transcript_2659/m.7562 type:complete len:266 (-) Transcript_2659:78-875(-)